MRPPDEVFRRLNALLVEEFDLDKYLTMVLGEYDLGTGHLRLAQAGHPSPLLQRPDGSTFYVESYGLPIGLIDEADYTSQDLTLLPGERLILYSDGLTECPDPDGTALDEEGLSEIVRRGRGVGGAAFVDYLQSSLVDFAGTSDFPDDLSAIILERHAEDSVS